MMPKFHPDHAVEIVAPKYGSAYRIGGSLLLTCKHLFDDDNRCKVRFRLPLNYSDKQDIDAKVIWKAPDNIQYLCQNKSLQKFWQNSQNPPHIDV